MLSSLVSLLLLVIALRWVISIARARNIFCCLSPIILRIFIVPFLFNTVFLYALNTLDNVVLLQRGFSILTQHMLISFNFKMILFDYYAFLFDFICDLGIKMSLFFILNCSVIILTVIIYF